MNAIKREAAFEIDPLFLSRWSRRAYRDEPVTLQQLFQLFEAARWAPSARNLQPWRFLYAVKEGAHWPLFLDLLYDRNRIWAQRASALVAVLSQHSELVDGVETRVRTHSFDAGAAWANLALQASLLGLSTRAMGGVDLERARVTLGIPDEVELHAIIAIGWPGPEDDLPDHLKGLEAPNQRKPVDSFAFEGPYPE